MIEIILNHREPRDETRQIAYVSVSGVNDYAFRFQVGDVPIELTTDQEVQEHLEAREDELHLFCLKKTYPGADPWDFQDPEKSELQNFLDWIEAGHQNKILVGYDENEDPIYEYEIITNHIYAATHPLRYPPSDEEISEALGYLEVVDRMDYEQLEDYIETEITTLTKARDYMIKLSHAFLALVKIVDSKSDQ